MRELSLNILDIAENSVKAGASFIQIRVTADTGRDLLGIEIADDGCGMTPEFLAKVTDPFTTTRTTRKVGMGIPLFKMAAELAGGSFSIESAPGVGTTVRADFSLGHIDRAPLGDLADTMTALVSESTTNAGKETDFSLTYSVDGREFEFDTRELKEQLGGVPADSPEILSFVRTLLEDNINEINGGEQI